MKDSIKIEIKGGAQNHRIKAKGLYLITVGEDGGVERIRQNALKNSDAEDFANDTVLAGAMMWGAEQLIRRLEKIFPGMDIRGQTQKVYDQLKNEDTMEATEEEL